MDYPCLHQPVNIFILYILYKNHLLFSEYSLVTYNLQTITGIQNLEHGQSLLTKEFQATAKGGNRIIYTSSAQLKF